MIEGVTFDWWNTLAVTSPDQDRRLRTLRIERLLQAIPEDERRRMDLREDRLLAAYDRQTEVLSDAWGKNVDIYPPDQIEMFREFAGIPKGWDHSSAIAEAFGGALLQLPPTIFPHVPETLEWLKREGYAVGLISNTGRTWGMFLRKIQDRLGIGKYFDARIFSDEVRVRKPESQIFEEALSKLGLPPERVVHVGDDVTADIAGAKRHGMRAIWFNTGFWRGARADSADAEIADHNELPPILRRWRA